MIVDRVARAQLAPLTLFRPGLGKARFTRPTPMQELSEIQRVLGKQIPEAPREVILDLDANQNDQIIE